ncbi:hypothetical protein Tco_0348901 [Tanacetum coccineum]
MQFLMGVDDIYQPIRSSLLTREILPEVKDAFVIVSREESHRGIPASLVKTEKPQAFAFVSRTNDNNNKRNNENWSNNNGSNVNRGNYDSLLSKNYGLKGYTIDTCFEIIGYPPSFKRNPNLKPFGNLNNNRTNFADTKELNLTVGHSNGTLAKITHVGNLKLYDNVYLFDVLVVPEYCISLLSVHKLIKDSKLSVSFDETTCYIQDL